MTGNHAGCRRIAVIGAGPSGLFAAQALAGQDTLECTVDLYDRLPTPYGLLRYGVAPDHTSIKAVANALAKVLESPRISFTGLVEFGRDVAREELLQAYDAVVYAVGAPRDLTMGIPGEDLPGSGSAREFVEWYGGHPDARPQSLAGVTGAATIGVGNVALDVGRILAKQAHALTTTDMPDPVLAELAASPITDVWIIGRRGPQHAAFTTNELRELTRLDGVQLIIDPAHLEGIDEEGLDRRTRTNLGILRDAAAAPRDPDAPRRLHLLFWHRPVRLDGADRVESLTVERTRLDADVPVADPALAPPPARVVGTGELSTLPVQLVLRAIGYRGAPLPGVPFDEVRAVIPHDEGRVLDAPGGTRCPREYVTGWIKRGPTGVIGTNKSDAAQSVAHLLEDLAAVPPQEPQLKVVDLLAARGVRPATFADWQAIDAAEQARGAARGRARTKLGTWEELGAVIG